MDNAQNTMDQMMAEFEESFRVPRRGEVVRGKVVLVSDSEIVVNIGYKSDGVLAKSEVTDDANADLKSLFAEGDEIDAMIVKLDDGNGNVLLSVKKIKQGTEWNELEEIYANEQDVEVTVASITKGGLIAYYKEIKGFIPASLISFRHVDNLEQFVGNTYKVKVIEFNKRRNKVVFSRKEFALAEKSEMLENTWKNIEVGSVIKGEVKRIADFGAFVDLGGVDGLIHNSEISWGRNAGAKSALKAGQEVEAVVISADKETGKVSLSIKQLSPSPWSVFEDKYNYDDTYVGRVVSIVDFGAFVELESGLEGLVHISQISNDRVERVSDSLSVGEEVNVKIIEADLQNRKLKLSIKAALAPEYNDYNDYDAE